MNEERRPKKVIRLNYWKNDPGMGAHITILGNPAEVRIGTAADKFLAVREDGVSLSPGMGNNVNVQGLSSNMRYAGMISDLPFPLSIMPVTPATPLPSQVIVPPFLEVLPKLRELAVIASSFVGV